MENELLKYAMSYGIFALLFCYLLLYILKTQEKRDEKSQEREMQYQKIITENQSVLEKLTQRFNIIEDVKKDVKEIKKYIYKECNK